MIVGIDDSINGIRPDLSHFRKQTGIFLRKGFQKPVGPMDYFFYDEDNSRAIVHLNTEYQTVDLCLGFALPGALFQEFSRFSQDEFSWIMGTNQQGYTMMPLRFINDIGYSFCPGWTFDQKPKALKMVYLPRVRGYLIQPEWPYQQQVLL